MARSRNTDRTGTTFPEATVEQVWNKGREIPNYDRRIWRHDACGSAIKRGDYGNVNSKNGWEIDHIRPVAQDGGDELSNLQPLQWETNRDKGDTYPWKCP